MAVAQAFRPEARLTSHSNVQDHARLVVLGTPDDTPARWLHTGEALSAVLLESTARGLVTCPLTHAIEQPVARRMVADLLPHRSVAQVLIRIGTAPEGDRPPLSPRRPVPEVLTFTRT